MWINRLKQALICVPVTMALVACGGSSPDTKPPATNTSITVSGMASKGPLDNAMVKFYKVNDDGTKGELLAEKRTASNGSYTVEVPNYTGVVLAEVSVDGATKMFDEATNSTISAPAGLSMRASFPTVTGVSSYSAQINPFTEMATVQADKSTGRLNASNVTRTNSDMAAALTFNPLTAAPEFNQAGQPTNAAAVVLASVSKLAKDGSLGCTTGTQAEKVLCVVNQLKTTAAEAKAGVGPTGSAANNPVAVTLQNAISSVSKSTAAPDVTLMPPSGGSVEVPTLAAAIAKAKAFFATLRSNITALGTADDNGVTFRSQLETFKKEVDDGTAPIQDSVVPLVTTMQRGIDWYDGIVNGRASFNNEKTFSDKGLTNRCILLSDSKMVDGKWVDIYASNKDDIYLIVCSEQGETQHGTCYSNSTPTACYRNWNHTVAMFPDPSDATNYAVYTRTMYNAVINNHPEPTVYVGKNSPFESTVTVTKNSTDQKVNALTWVGDMAPTYRVTGNFTYSNGVYSENNPASSADKHLVNASVRWTTDANGLEQLALNGRLDNFTNGKIISTLEMLPGSSVSGKKDAVDGYISRNGSQSILLKLKASYGTNSFQGDFSASDAQSDLSGTKYLPTKMSFTGKLANATNEIFSGTLTSQIVDFSKHDYSKDPSTANPMYVKLGFTGIVTVPNRPTLTLTTSITQESFGNSVNNVSAAGQYRQDANDASQVVNFKLTKLHNEEPLMTLETIGGIKVEMVGNTTRYPVTMGSLAVGVIDKSQSRIEYADGTSESY